MTLALATRGYLCQGGVGTVCPPYGPGPDIIGIEAISPSIKGSALIREEAPTIMVAGVPAPSIDASATPSDPPAADAPVITGAGDQKPDIDSSKR